MDAATHAYITHSVADVIMRMRHMVDDRSLILVPLAIVPPYNADFDGDEMNGNLTPDLGEHFAIARLSFDDMQRCMSVIKFAWNKDMPEASGRGVDDAPYWLGRTLIQMLVPGGLSADACVFNYAAQRELGQQIKEAHGLEASVRFFADLGRIVAEWAKW